MSFRKMLKSKGPKTDSCGTPLGTFPHLLNEVTGSLVMRLAPKPQSNN